MRKFKVDKILGYEIAFSDTPQNKEVVSGQRYCYPIGDIDILTEKLNFFIMVGELSDAPDSFDYQLFQQKYNWGNAAKEVLKIYQNI